MDGIKQEVYLDQVKKSMCFTRTITKTFVCAVFGGNNHQSNAGGTEGLHGPVIGQGTGVAQPSAGIITPRTRKHTYFLFP